MAYVSPTWNDNAPPDLNVSNIQALTTIAQTSQPYIGTCSTAAATAEKVVTCADFVLAAGVTIMVAFDNVNTAASPTLNVNGTGAVAIYCNGSAATATQLQKTVMARYDGNYWQLVHISPSIVTVTFTTSGWVKNSSTTCYEQTVAVAGLLATDGKNVRVEPVGSTDAAAQALTDAAYAVLAGPGGYVACNANGQLYARCPAGAGAPTTNFQVAVVISR